MDCATGPRPIAVVSACLRADGLPTFVFNRVEVTQEEAENGVHYDLAEAALLAAGFEEPFVHFDEDEAPAFLHPAVRRALGRVDDCEANHRTPLEVTSCRASSK